jgi:hypothetical protein
MAAFKCRRVQAAFVMMAHSRRLVNRIRQLLIVHSSQSQSRHLRSQHFYILQHRAACSFLHPQSQQQKGILLGGHPSSTRPQKPSYGLYMTRLSSPAGMGTLRASPSPSRSVSTCTAAAQAPFGHRTSFLNLTASYIPNILPQHRTSLLPQATWPHPTSFLAIFIPLIFAVQS